MRHLILFLGLAWPVAASAVDTSETARHIVEQANTFRAEQSLPAVRVSAELQAAAEAFALHMANTGEHSHTADGRTPTQRAMAAGYDFCIVTENIAYHASSRDPASAAQLAGRMMRGWKDSPGHRKNMLDAAVTETGVGLARDARGRYFAAQMFGRARSAAIRFSIFNPSAEEVRYSVGAQANVAPPRVARTHEICRPVAVRFELPGGGTFAEPAVDGARYTIRDGKVIRD
jgi:hypothetical protein